MTIRFIDESALIITGQRARVRSSTDARRTTATARSRRSGSSHEAAIQQTKSWRGESASSPYRSKLEAAYAQRLALELKAGAIKAWAYEPLSFRLGTGRRYRPDFLIWTESGIEFVEVKGRWIKNKRDGMTRLYWAAKEYPMFTWRVVVWKDGGFDGHYIVG